MTGTHPDSLTGADVFAVPDRSLSPIDPAQVVPWLRALPVGTILRDDLGAAWHLDDRPGSHPSTRAWLATGDEYRYQLDNPTDMATMAAWRPFRIIWTSGGGQ